MRNLDTVVGRVGTTGRKPLDIGDGFLVLRHGMDANGNHSVWVSHRGNRARKIQTNGNLPAVHDPSGDRGVITTEGAEQIKAFYRQYMAPKRRKGRHGPRVVAGPKFPGDF